MSKQEIFYKNNNLFYLKSKQVNVFPSGRRKSEVVSDGATKKYLPIDPEARLNTEANNRKHSGLNGYKQDYLNYWHNNGELSIVLDGYLFNIDLTADYATPEELGNYIMSELGNNIDSVYVNIQTEDIAFFSFTDETNEQVEYYTTVLRDQTTENAPSACLDLQIPGTNPASFYFSGLTFSSTDYASKFVEDRSIKVTSKRLLFKNGDTWQIDETFRLPKIDHGEDKDSIVIKKLFVDSIVQGENKGKVPSMQVASSGDGSKYQLQFSNVLIN